jgi:hypothetical protein
MLAHYRSAGALRTVNAAAGVGAVNAELSHALGL